MWLFNCITIGTLFEHFYLKKKNCTKTLKKNVQNITPSLNITPTLKLYLFFQVYFLLLLAALSNSLSFNALLWNWTGQLKVESDQELTSHELCGAPVPAVTPFVGHSREDPFHISSGCWDAQDVAGDTQHVRQVSYLKESHPPGSHTIGLPFIFSIFFEPLQNGFCCGAFIIKFIHVDFMDKVELGGHPFNVTKGHGAMVQRERLQWEQPVVFGKVEPFLNIWECCVEKCRKICPCHVCITWMETLQLHFS